MKLKILSFIATVFILGQASGNAPANRSGKHKHSGAEHTSANPTAPSNPPQPSKYLIVEINQNRQQSEQATARSSSYWKEATRPAYASNWVLVIIGAVAGGLAWATLCAIKRQGDLLKQQIDSMKQSERPWIVASVSETGIRGMSTGDDVDHHVTAAITLKNCGKAPAFIRSAQCGAFFAKYPSMIDNPLENFFDEAFQTGSVAVLPQGGKNDCIKVTSPDSLGRAEWYELVNSGGSFPTPIVFGVIRYDDPYGKDHETRFCYGSLGGKMMLVGTPSCNICT